MRCAPIKRQQYEIIKCDVHRMEHRVHGTRRHSARCGLLADRA